MATFKFGLLSFTVRGGLIAHTRAVNELTMHRHTRCICHSSRITQDPHLTVTLAIVGGACMAC